VAAVAPKGHNDEVRAEDATLRNIIEQRIVCRQVYAVQ
jgi:hypothetical protein